MALNYSISNSTDYVEIKIPIANYYQNIGLFLNATSHDNWKGCNDEYYTYCRKNDMVLLYDNKDKLVKKISLNDYVFWLKNLSDTYESLDMLKPVVNILKSLEINKDETITIEFN